MVQGGVVMAQTKEGAIKMASKKIGISEAEYIQNVKAQKKWCYLCREWHDLAEFGVDSYNGDGLSSICRSSRNKRAKEKYIPKERTWELGRSFVTERDGDRKQARGRVNYLVKIGLLPKPNAVRCVDCGHISTETERHEYDHYLGYSKNNHEDVEVVCSKCHHLRHPKNIARDDKGRFKSG